MFWVSRIFELLSATKRLNDSKPHIMTAASNLALALLLGLFGIMLAALMTGGLLYLAYLQLVLAGAGVPAALLCTAALTLVILAAAGLGASAAFRRVRGDVEQIFHSQSPIVAPVVNRVGNVANAFLTGLRTPRGKPQKTPDRGR